MKYPILLFAVLTLACQRFDYYGEDFSTSQVESAESVLARLASGEDSVETTFRAEVAGVCQKKGCWITIVSDDATAETMVVKFKDYGFFMPIDLSGKKVVMHGNAYIETTSVDELRHYAEDAGESEAEIAKITEPKKEYKFLADGVVILD
jgi:hypothetical protein